MNHLLSTTYKIRNSMEIVFLRKSSKCDNDLLFSNDLNTINSMAVLWFVFSSFEIVFVTSSYF